MTEVLFEVDVSIAPKPIKLEPNRFDVGANLVALVGLGKRGQARAYWVCMISERKMSALDWQVNSH